MIGDKESFIVVRQRELFQVYNERLDGLDITMIET